MRAAFAMMAALAMLVGASLLGSISQSHSQQPNGPVVDCDRLQDAANAAFCRNVLRSRKVRPSGSSADDLNGRAESFVIELMRAWSQPNADGFAALSALYADQVSYYGKTTKRQLVLDDKEKFATRWPERKYELNKQSLVAKCNQVSSTCTVDGMLDWQVRSPARKASNSGKARFSYRLIEAGQSFVIVSETSSVVKHSPQPDERQQPAPSTSTQQAEDQVRALESRTGERAAGTIVVQMSVAATASYPPTINGTTNLPDGTVVIVMLVADAPCAPDCVVQEEAVVRSGRFEVTSEPFRGNIMQGPYTIELITPGADKQPAGVQAVIGRNGEYLAGPLVVWFLKGKYVPRSANPSDAEKAWGYQIRYVQRVNAVRSGRPPAYWRRIEADNGAVHAIDINSISNNTNGTAVAVTCIVDNDTCPLGNMSRFHFDCRGHYQDLDRRGPVMLAPPRSVVGQMATIACSRPRFP